MLESRILATLAYGWVALCLLLALRDATPPAPLGEDAPAEDFSAIRAMDVVREIAGVPRPRGSEGHAAARSAITTRLSDLGLTPVIHTVTQRRAGSAWVTLSTLTNIMARIEGEGDSREAIGLMAHYDSVAGSPGAADDASGVATVLEAARALMAGDPLDRDVLILITDGEEEGLLGARALAGQPDLVGDLRVVLNFEARGHRGPSVMFETVGGSRGLAEAYAATEHPFTSSVSDEIYRRMPNGTDLTVFRGTGVHGMNFAFIGGISHYHSALDTPEALDRGSLQQHGEAAVSLVREFGRGPLDLGGEGDNAVYFSALGKVFGYPTSSRWPVLAAALVALFIAIGFGFRRGWIRIRSLLFGSLFVPVSAALAILASLAVTVFVEDATTDSVVFRDQRVFEEGWYVLGIALLAISITTFVLLQLRTRAKPEGMVAGSLLWWAVGAVVTAGWFPGASYLFAWPLLSASMALLLFLRRERRLHVSPGRGLGILVLSTPAWVLWIPLLWLLFESLRLPVAPAIATASVLLLGAAVPPLFFAMAHRRWLIPLGAGLLGFVVIGHTAVSGAPGTDRPYQESFSYLADSDGNHAVLVPRGAVASPWGGKLMATSEDVDAWRLDPTLGRRAVPGVVAPFVLVETPTVVDGEWQESDNDERRWVGTLSNPESNGQLLIVVEGSAKAGITEIDGVPHEGPEPRVSKLSWVAPPGELEIALSADAEGTVSLRLFTVRRDLPDFSGTQISPRPDDVIPRPGFGDETVISRRFDL